ncbi:hypothetical protein [Couchioplanes caeruleus]|uniref:Uncharacterized protein n=2 Tax=Couchioplanes caeruleus TaxID=56438 RepID=A0A1K0GYP7_9ACTN|nr:hypothetical protein [Couchioplanes caeruleus]OJF14555.1 hypothetical protein BG844_09500 [Couchioplanes caeruleus subsp. caeruleus]ROP21284.1 hypothetical protein EDD30_7682 [Couchioplanes caeruleus]
MKPGQGPRIIATAAELAATAAAFAPQVPVVIDVEEIEPGADPDQRDTWVVLADAITVPAGDDGRPAGPKAHREFRENAPAVVQRLAEIDEDAIDFRITRIIMVDFDERDSMPVALTLDTRGRAAEAVIKDVFGSTLPDALRGGMVLLAEQADAHAEAIVQGCRRGSDNRQRGRAGIAPQRRAHGDGATA